jgi:DNA invertase Pin-like site-specific DNA recombinase
MKRAAIYIRVSSERQADKVSPEAQERDCLDYCLSHEYQVTEIYRDIEKYRVGGRMVEPSGTRADRPQLRRLLADADAGLFDVLIAWREDRLYRGVNRAMLELSERVKSKVFSIELAKEYYDPGVAVVKAWAAGIELEAKHDRFIMGVNGRLAQGKTWCATPPMGYKIEDGLFVIDDAEAEWVKWIFKSYGSGVSLRDIQRHLINSGVEQRRKNHKYHWNLTVLRKMLKARYYYSGIFHVKWDGSNYESIIPPIISEEEFKAVKDRLAKFHAWPAANLKTQALAAGKIYCAACGARMNLVRSSYFGKQDYLYYRCWNYNAHLNKPGCAHSARVDKFDKELWKKIWDVISKPGEFENAIRAKIEALRREEKDADRECERIERQLQENGFERDKVITWTRQGRISEADLDKQLAALTIQEMELRKESNKWRLMTGGQAERLEGLFKIFRTKTQRGIYLLESETESPERADKIFQARRKIVQEIVSRVELDENKKPKIYTEIDLPGLLAVDDIPAP